MNSYGSMDYLNAISGFRFNEMKVSRFCSRKRKNFPDFGRKVG